MSTGERTTVAFSDRGDYRPTNPEGWTSRHLSSPSTTKRRRFSRRWAKSPWSGRDLKVFEIVVVDDGSSDGSAELVTGLAHVWIVRHPCNGGYRRAIKSGIAAAAHDTIVITDADLTYPVEMASDLPAAGVPVSTCARALARGRCSGCASTQLGLRTRWRQGGNGVVSQKKDFGRGLRAETERTWKTPGRDCAYVALNGVRDRCGGGGPRPSPADRPGAAV
jgi:hypothetical protein